MGPQGPAGPAGSAVYWSRINADGTIHSGNLVQSVNYFANTSYILNLTHTVVGCAVLATSHTLGLVISAEFIPGDRIEVRTSRGFDIFGISMTRDSAFSIMVYC